MYRQVRLREARPAEVAFQAGALKTGTTRVQLATNFLNSSEFKNGTGPRLNRVPALRNITPTRRHSGGTEVSRRSTTARSGQRS
jgi:hypothetical protein